MVQVVIPRCAAVRLLVLFAAISLLPGSFSMADEPDHLCRSKTSQQKQTPGLVTDDIDGGTQSRLLRHQSAAFGFAPGLFPGRAILPAKRGREPLRLSAPRRLYELDAILRI